MNATTEELLADACTALVNAKAMEAAAGNRRREAEAEVIALMGEIKDEGTTRAEAGRWKATVTCSVRRTVDADKLAEIAPQIPEAIGKRLITWKPSVVLKELRFIENNEPEIYATVAQAITAKPGKPEVKVERVDDVQEAA